MAKTICGFTFGPWNCKWTEAFYLSNLSIAFVNLKPIVPGHCLVISRRCVPRFADLTSEEVSDLWQTVHKISEPLRKQFDAQALTLAIQDGEVAGQTVPHVHVHIVPRKPGDFQRNDQIYDELEKSNQNRGVKVDAEEDRKPRTIEEMTAEALQLRSLYSDSLPIPNDE